MNIMAKVTEYLAKKNKLEQEEKELELLKSELIEYMGSETEKVIGQYKLTYKDCKRTDIDRKKLKEEFKEAYDSCETITTYKRFTAK